MRHRTRFAILLAAALVASAAIALGLGSAFAGTGPAYSIHLPLILLQPTDTPTATLPPTATPVTPEPPPPMPGEDVQCQTQGTIQMCASVDDASPTRYTTVTVYGRLYVDGFGVPGMSMSASWHYKTSNPSCGGTTDGGGLASCSRYISGATAGYQVNIDVSIHGYSATTSFTPQ